MRSRFSKSRFALATMLAFTAVNYGSGQSANAQTDSSAGVRSATELRFGEGTITSRRNPLDLFKLHESPQSGADQVQFTAAGRPQPPAAQPPAVVPPIGLPETPVAQEAPKPLMLERSGIKPAEVSETDSRQAEREGLVPLQNRRLTSVVTAVDISMEGIGTGLVPTGSKGEASVPIGLPTGVERGVPFKCVHWQPTLMQHYPLYYEEAMLERHGHVRWGCLQPLASGTRFFATSALMPYLRVLRPKYECQYVLGHYRAGSCVPMLRDTLPYDKRAAVAETLAAAGFFWGMPL